MSWKGCDDISDSTLSNGLQEAITGFQLLEVGAPNSSMALCKNPAKDFCWWDLDGVCRRRRVSCVQW